MKKAIVAGLVLWLGMGGGFAQTESSEPTTSSSQETTEQSLEKVEKKQRAKMKNHHQHKKMHKQKSTEMRQRNMERWRDKRLQRCKDDQKCEERVNKSYGKRQKMMGKRKPNNNK